MAAHGDVRAVGSFFFALVSGGGWFVAGWGSRQADGWCQPTRSALRSLSAARLLLMGREVGSVRGGLGFEAGS